MMIQLTSSNSAFRTLFSHNTMAIKQKRQFVPENIFKCNSRNICDRLMKNARISHSTIDIMREMLKDEISEDTHLFGASKIIFDSIASKRQFDEYGRPTKGRNHLDNNTI